MRVTKLPRKNRLKITILKNKKVLRCGLNQRSQGGDIFVRSVTLAETGGLSQPDHTSRRSRQAALNYRTRLIYTTLVELSEPMPLLLANNTSRIPVLGELEAGRVSASLADLADKVGELSSTMDKVKDVSASAVSAHRAPMAAMQDAQVEGSVATCPTASGDNAEQWCTIVRGRAVPGINLQPSSSLHPKVSTQPPPPKTIVGTRSPEDGLQMEHRE